MLLNIFAIIFLFGYVNCAIPERETRIVNGEDANIEDYPFIVSVRYLNKHMCGGTMVNKFFILTAAHCPEGLHANNLTIQYGLDYITSDLVNVIQVKNFVMHKDYNPDQYYINDIAVLELTDPITFNGVNVKQVKLLTPLLDNILFRSPAIAIGWGLDKTGGEVQKQLQSVKIFAYSALECTLAHGTKVNNFMQICAGLPKDKKGVCNGDSGGPLIVRGYEAGIVSWGYLPCAENGPAIYTRVSHYINWIEDNTKILM